MKIKLDSQYKSLYPFESHDLSNLTIITGKNGSGKSQLLELIDKKTKHDSSLKDIKIIIDPEVVFLQSEGIIRNNNVFYSNSNFKNKIKNIYNSFNQIHVDQLKLRRYIINNNLEHSIFKERSDLLSNDAEYQALLNSVISRANPGYPPGTYGPYSTKKLDTENAVLLDLFNSNKNIFLIVDEVCLFNNKNEFSIKELDFYNTPISEKLLDNSTLFSSELELIFYNYALRRHLNSVSGYYKEKKGFVNASITDNEFYNKYTAPWDIINNLFTDNNIDFYFTGVSFEDFHPEVDPHFRLVKKQTHQEINLNELSSGEKIIIGLIIKLFTSSYYEGELQFPQMLILDEPDAHLHPEISKLLLEVLDKNFVNKYGVRVILTTHSPSTIALAPEESIYQLTNGLNTSLNKISKDEALKLLTGFIPTLSIDYKNHRQVFVESPTDIFYYQSIYEKHSQIKQFTHKLYFMSNSLGKGNCDLVYDITAELRNSGNQTAYGIVDWDLKNEDKGFAFVHGKDDRYSVENYIFDPIYVVCYLISKDIEKDSNPQLSEKLGLGKFYDQFSIGNEPEEKLQEIVRFFFSEYEKRFRTDKYDSEKRKVNYLNGTVLLLPVWYLEMQGHKIVENIKLVFPEFQGFKDEGKAQKALTKVMAKCYPFVPAATISVLERIGQ